MEVSIPLIQNQVIDHTGTYHIVQRTINGQTGLVIEEYIPEPEPEEEVLQNNSNTRAMIIDENENNNNGQMVLRGQNNVRGLPDPAGETIEGTFEINITPTPVIDIMYIKYTNSNNDEIDMSFIYNNTNRAVSYSINSGYNLLIVRPTSTQIYFNIYNNYSASSYNLLKNSYICVFNNANAARILLYNNNGFLVDCIGNMNNSSDENVDLQLSLSSQVFNLNLVNVTNYQ